MLMKRIVIVANFCGALDGRKDDRFVYLAEWLASSGRYDVELIVSDFVHHLKSHQVLSKEDLYKSKITMCHEPGYISHKGIKRLYSHHVWGKNVLRYIKSRPRPDIVYCAIPSLTAAHKLANYCESNNIKFVVDVQDLWPEATFMFFKNRIIQKLSYPMAKYIDTAYSKADAIVAVSKTYAERAKRVNKKNAPALSVYLGTDADLFFKARDHYTNRYTDFTIGYIGTLSYSYDLHCVIDAIRILNESGKYPPIKFLVMGSGPLQQEFSKHAANVGVSCEFTGRLPYEEMVGRLCKCDVVVNPIVKGAAQSITNKIGDYALSGRPVVNTQECTEYRGLIDSYGCGINCIPGDPQNLAKALGLLIESPSLREQMGQQSLKLGLERFDRRTSYKEIEDLLDNL